MYERIQLIPIVVSAVFYCQQPTFHVLISLFYSKENKKNEASSDWLEVLLWRETLLA